MIALPVLNSAPNDTERNIQFENALMRQVAAEHKAAFPTHNPIVFNNFIHCFDCGFHAHTTGHGYLLQHDATYENVKRIYPEQENYGHRIS